MIDHRQPAARWTVTADAENKATEILTVRPDGTEYHVMVRGPENPSTEEQILLAFWGELKPGRVAKGQDPSRPLVYVTTTDESDRQVIKAIEPRACPCCADEHGFNISAHGCACGRTVCTFCKVGDDGEPAPCSGRCKICRGAPPAVLRPNQYRALVGLSWYPLEMLRLAAAE